MIKNSTPKETVDCFTPYLFGCLNKKRTAVLPVYNEKTRTTFHPYIKEKILTHLNSYEIANLRLTCRTIHLGIKHQFIKPTIFDQQNIYKLTQEDIRRLPLILKISDLNAFIKKHPTLLNKPNIRIYLKNYFFQSIRILDLLKVIKEYDTLLQNANIYSLELSYDVDKKEVLELNKHKLTLNCAYQMILDYFHNLKSLIFVSYTDTENMNSLTMHSSKITQLEYRINTPHRFNHLFSVNNFPNLKTLLIPANSFTTPSLHANIKKLVITPLLFAQYIEINHPLSFDLFFMNLKNINSIDIPIHFSGFMDKKLKLNPCLKKECTLKKVENLNIKLRTQNISSNHIEFTSLILLLESKNEIIKKTYLNSLLWILRRFPNTKTLKLKFEEITTFSNKDHLECPEKKVLITFIHSLNESITKKRNQFLSKTWKKLKTMTITLPFKTIQNYNEWNETFEFNY